LSEKYYLSLNFAFNGSGLDTKTEKQETRHAYAMIIEKRYDNRKRT